VELGHWLIGEARSGGRLKWSHAVTKPRPFVLSTERGFKKRPTIPDGNGTVARGLFDRLMNHVRRLCNGERAM
jgi:hypothetical protein